jgi:hypothetical protein
MSQPRFHLGGHFISGHSATKNFQVFIVDKKKALLTMREAEVLKNDVDRSVDLLVVPRGEGADVI